MTLRKSLSKNLKRLLFEKDLKQKDLALALGISPSTVSTWINEDDWPTPENVERLASFFDVPEHELFRDTETHPMPPASHANGHSAAELLEVVETTAKALNITLDELLAGKIPRVSSNPSLAELLSWLEAGGYQVVKRK